MSFPSASPLVRSHNTSRLAGMRSPAALLWLITVLTALLCLSWAVVWRSVLLGPWVEETLFRSGLQTALSKRMAGHWANLGTALAFAACHAALQPGLAAWLTVLPAWVIGIVFQRTGRLLPCIALHAGANLLWHLALASHLAPLLSP
jgi:membrane protease YdiL (CAAX protease family)